MAERDYAGVLPTTPPEGLLPWLKEQGFLKAELLVYKMEWYYDPLREHKVQAVQLSCTACGQRAFAEKVNSAGCHAAYAPAPFGFIHPETGEHLISGGHCLCPECGAEVNIKHVSSVTEGSTYEECYPMTVTRYEDKLVLLGWSVRRYFFKDGKSEFKSHPWEAYVIERKGIVRLNAYRKNMGDTIILRNEWEQRKKYTDAWGPAKIIYPWDAKLLIGSTAENSKLDILLKATKKKGETHLVSYLRLWLKRPQVENLVVQGASILLSEMIKRERDNYGYTYCNGRPVANPTIPILDCIDWKEKSPSKMLRMNKGEFQICVKNKWDLDTLRFWNDEKERGRVLSVEDVSLAKIIGFFDCKRVRDIGLDWMKVARYLQKQKQKDKRCDMSILWDYWKIAENIGENLTLPDVRFPPRLMAAHDRVERMRRWREEAKKAAKREARAHLFEERYAALISLAWEHDGILIRPVRDEQELSKEGAVLHHCVGSYAETHVKGEQPIFLIRRTKKPDKPWYTLQLDVKTLTVLQNRGSRNCDRTKEIQAFEVAWVAWLREQAAPKKKKRAQQQVQAAAV